MATYSQSKRLIQSAKKYGGKTMLISLVDSSVMRVKVRFKLSIGTKRFRHPLKAIVILISQTT